MRIPGPKYRAAGRHGKTAPVFLRRAGERGGALRPEDSPADNAKLRICPQARGVFFRPARRRKANPQASTESRLQTEAANRGKAGRQAAANLQPRSPQNTVFKFSATGGARKRKQAFSNLHGGSAAPPETKQEGACLHQKFPAKTCAKNIAACILRAQAHKKMRVLLFCEKGGPRQALQKIRPSGPSRSVGKRLREGL